MKTKHFVLPLLLVGTLFSCVSTKKYQALNDKYASLNNQLIESQKETKYHKDLFILKIGISKLMEKHQ